MPPQVGRMHHSHPSNPFQHLNSQHSIPQSSYQSQASHLPGSFTSQPSFGGSAINGGISPFPASSAYGASAFTPGAGSSVFNGGAIGGQGQGQGLASVAAQQGFARGAAMQEHTAHQLEAASMDSKSGANSRIRQVWRHNLEQEMAVLRQLIIKYPYVSMVRCYSLAGIAVLLVQLLGSIWSIGVCTSSHLSSHNSQFIPVPCFTFNVHTLTRFSRTLNSQALLQDQLETSQAARLNITTKHYAAMSTFSNQSSSGLPSGHQKANYHPNNPIRLSSAN